MPDGKLLPCIVEKLQSYRVTLTLPVLCNARRTVFLVTGVGKAGIVGEILRDGEGSSYPASRVASMSANVTWLLDKAAAGRAGHRKDLPGFENLAGLIHDINKTRGIHEKPSTVGTL